MNEIIFAVEAAPDGGYAARALTASIFAEGDSLVQLRDAVRAAVRCHFEDGERPLIIRLLFTRDEVIEA
jgi:hypothetical protein